MTTTADPQILPLPSRLGAGFVRRVYAAQWRLFNDWCDLVGLRALPAEPLTVVRYLVVRADDGASIATLRLATTTIAKPPDPSFGIRACVPL